MHIAFMLFISIFEVIADGHGFGYSRFAQIQWQKEYMTCGGVLQSPVVINSSEARPIGMPALEMIRYHNLLPEQITLQNNGHSIALSITQSEDCFDFDSEIPYIFGALLHDEYVFEGLHFHWGGRNNRGSEHILDDIRYPVEMHLIHRNSKYRDIKHALKHKNGLTVLGIFFQLRNKKNEQLEHILRYFPFIRENGQSIKMNSSFMLAGLIPTESGRFYTYKGSLTTPPCSEVVTWIVFSETIPISLSQLNQFRRISDPSGKSLLVDNYRHVQPIGQRQIFVREPMMKHSKYFSTANFLNWNWFTTKQDTNLIV